MYLEVQTLLLRPLKCLPNNPCMLLTSRVNVALKLLRHAHESSDHALRRLNRVPISSDLLRDVKAPEYTRDVDVQRALSNMDAGTYSSTSAVSEVVALVRVDVVDVVCGWELAV